MDRPSYPTPLAFALNDHTLNDGTTLPAIGLGTVGLRGIAGAEAMAAGLDEGYRLLATRDRCRGW